MARASLAALAHDEVKRRTDLWADVPGSSMQLTGVVTFYFSSLMFQRKVNIHMAKNLNGTGRSKIISKYPFSIAQKV